MYYYNIMFIVRTEFNYYIIIQLRVTRDHCIYSTYHTNMIGSGRPLLLSFDRREFIPGSLYHTRVVMVMYNKMASVMFYLFFFTILNYTHIVCRQNDEKRVTAAVWWWRPCHDWRHMWREVQCVCV